MAEPRLILFHKQSTSARLRFFKLAYGGVCAFDALPTLSQLLDDKPEQSVALHPATYVTAAEKRLGMSAGDLEAEGEYMAYVDVPDGVVQVFLARFTSIDPPFHIAEAEGGEFVELTQTRNLPQVELELLRLAYETVMGG